MIDRDKLTEKLMVLNEQLWEGRVDRRRIDLWLSNFTGKHTDQRSEQDYALLLLSHVMYFGEREIRELLRAMFRDHYRYRVVQEVRRRLNGSSDVAAIHEGYRDILSRTRFSPMGNPSESGTHLMYWFRQENQLDPELFVHSEKLADRPLEDPAARLVDQNIQRLVFLDDFCGSGCQALELTESLVPQLRRAGAETGVSLTISYLVLFANAEGVARVREEGPFDSVDAVFELDQSYGAFSDRARQFAGGVGGVNRETIRRMAAGYGELIWREWPLGFNDDQLLLAFHHNTPDNTLPILWAGPPEYPFWHGPFGRYPKYYGNKHS